MIRRACLGAAVAALALLLGACERPPVDTVQRGYRGTAMMEVYNPRLLAHEVAANTAPEALPSVPPGGPTAGQTMQNVKVLGDVGIAEFTRTMQAMTSWVAPKEGCAFCHDLQNLAADTKYQKVIARRMLEMTRHLNTDWKAHVNGTGVTCWTCHRGNNVPQQTWFESPQQKAIFAGWRAGQDAPAQSVGYASLPNDPFTPFLVGNEAIRVNGSSALAPPQHGLSVQQAESTYGLMMHMSQSLGVNCTYCHNTRSFQSWGQSTPQRMTAWYGIRMVRDLNTDFLIPLTSTFPASQRGPTGDVAKVSCATCHQGAFKPLYGAKMAAQYPALAAGGS